LNGLSKTAANGLSGATGDPITFNGRQSVTPGVVVEWQNGKETVASS
jgi:hypothetical protein